MKAMSEGKKDVKINKKIQHKKIGKTRFQFSPFTLSDEKLIREVDGKYLKQY
jgi:hypothetical protein